MVGITPANVLDQRANRVLDYSSICCFVGTNKGNVATFKILPASNGTYEAAFVGSSAVEDTVINVIPMDADSGGLALATPSAVGGLRNGIKVNGVVIAVTASGCRIFKPPTSKGAHKSWEDYICDSAALVKTEGRGYSLVGLFGDGNARAFSIPALRDIGCAKINHIADMRRLSEACITPTGNIMTWVGPSEIGMFNVWGAGHGLYVSPINCLAHGANTAHRHPSKDRLFNPEAQLPQRPTITNMQWISGTQYISPADMDILSMPPPTNAMTN
jgi:syntaxin-binding protein 5